MRAGKQLMAPRFWSAIATMGVVALLPCSAPLFSRQLWAFNAGSFASLSHSTVSLSPSFLGRVPSLPPTWYPMSSVLADVTGDDVSEWVLAVWRPWRDWPIQHWSSVPSPIAGFHDAAGHSCHLILLDPRDGREIWAGSALPVPLLAVAVGDVDGDGINEVVALEGSYATGRKGPATHVDVWSWSGFGFTLEWRSPLGTFHQLRLVDADRRGILDIAVR